jgi:hypothetical protein
VLIYIGKAVKGVKQSVFYHEKELFPGSAIVNKRSFKMIDTRDKSAHFQKKDCFECLLPAYKTTQASFKTA